MGLVAGFIAGLDGGTCFVCTLGFFRSRGDFRRLCLMAGRSSGEEVVDDEWLEPAGVIGSSEERDDAKDDCPEVCEAADVPLEPTTETSSSVSLPPDVCTALPSDEVPVD